MLHRCCWRDEWNEENDDLVDCLHDTASTADIIDQLEAWLIAPEDCLVAIGDRDPALAGIIRDFLVDRAIKQHKASGRGLAVRVED